MKRMVLGRGLEALIPGAGASGAEEDTSSHSRHGVIFEIPISEIKPNPFQPRQVFDQAKLAELAESIRERGVIQPVVVRATENGYELIVGERRLKAVEKLGMPSIPAVVYDSTSNEESMELALIENIQRENLNAIEEATAYRRLMTECNLTQADVAGRVGKDRSSVANSLRLLSLPEVIQGMVNDGRLSAGQARTLLALQTDTEKIALAEKAIAEGLNVRELEKLVYNNKPARKLKLAESRSAQVVSVEEVLKRKFGTKVSINQKKKGGKIIFEYYTNDDLNRILDLFGAIETQ